MDIVPMVNDDEGRVPSFAVSAVIECLGWPDGAGTLVVNHIWLEHGRRVFAVEIDEQQSVRDPLMHYYELPANTKSTISIAFSPDHKTFASTHGDHTVKIVDFDTGRRVRRRACDPMPVLPCTHVDASASPLLVLAHAPARHFGVERVRGSGGDGGHGTPLAGTPRTRARAIYRQVFFVARRRPAALRAAQPRAARVRTRGTR